MESGLITPTALIGTGAAKGVTSYSSELAHVAGPLLEAIGQTANAIERAERQNRALEAASEEWEE